MDEILIPEGDIKTIKRKLSNFWKALSQNSKSEEFDLKCWTFCVKFGLCFVFFPELQYSDWKNTKKACTLAYIKESQCRIRQINWIKL